MKLNIAFPSTGRQKIIELEDEKKIRLFQDRRLAEEIDGTLLGEEYKGYIFKITGGSDKEGFPMKQGVLTSDRVRLFLAEGTSCYNRYRGQKRVGTRKRKSVRGAVISNEIVVVNLVITKKGEQEISDLTEVEKAIPNRLGPKRASKIRKLFSLTKKDNVKEYVIRREIPLKEGSKRKKPRSKAPKIQRLITARKLQHKRARKAEKLKGRERAKKEVEAYNQLIKKRRNEEIQRRRQLSSRRKSKLSKKEEGTTSTTTKKTEPTKTETTKTEPTKTTKRTQPTKTETTKTEPSTKKVKTTTKQPTKTVPTKTVPTKDTPKTTTTPTTQPTKKVPTKTTKPTKTVPTKDTPTTQPTKTVPTKETPTKTTQPTKTTKTVTKNAPTQPTKKTTPTKKTVPTKKPATKKN